MSTAPRPPRGAVRAGPRPPAQEAARQRLHPPQRHPTVQELRVGLSLLLHLPIQLSCGRQERLRASAHTRPFCLSQQESCSAVQSPSGHSCAVLYLPWFYRFTWAFFFLPLSFHLNPFWSRWQASCSMFFLDLVRTSCFLPGPRCSGVYPGDGPGDTTLHSDTIHMPRCSLCTLLSFSLFQSHKFQGREEVKASPITPVPSIPPPELQSE